MRPPLVALLFLVADVLGEKKGSISKHIKLSEEDKLIKILLAQYKRRGTYGRPLSAYNETITIKYNMQLKQILDLDERNQVLTLNVWDRYMWNDIHMIWDPVQHGGVDRIRVPAKKIWIPDVKLYNYADERLNERREAMCVIDHTGSVLWMPQAIYKSSCELDVRTFPFDVQKCMLKFGSWTYDGNYVDLKILINDTGHDKGQIDMSEYVASNSWEVLNYPAIRNAVNYSCCPNQPFIDLTFTVNFQRRATFYNYILILPCILLTSLTLVLFWIPPESPAKLMLGINIFVAFFLLLMLMESNLPPSAARVPLLGIYYCLNMVLITLSSFLNAFVVNLSFFGARKSIPHCVRMVMFEFFAKILCMENLVQPFRDKTISELTSRLVQPDRMPFLGLNGGDGTSKWAGSGRGDRSSGEIMGGDTSNDQHFAQLSLINSQLGELMEFIKCYKARINEKDRKDRVAREWKAVSLIFDRIFFLVYLTTIFTSLCVVLPIITNRDQSNGS